MKKHNNPSFLKFHMRDWSRSIPALTVDSGQSILEPMKRCMYHLQQLVLGILVRFWFFESWKKSIIIPVHSFTRLKAIAASVPKFDFLLKHGAGVLEHERKGLSISNQLLDCQISFGDVFLAAALKHTTPFSRKRDMINQHNLTTSCLSFSFPPRHNRRLSCRRRWARRQPTATSWGRAPRRPPRRMLWITARMTRCLQRILINL